MSQDGFNLQADKKLIKDINQATTPLELRDLLHASIERSSIAARDSDTGQFVRRNPLTPAAQTENEPEQVTRVENIGGKSLTFTGTELEVEQQISAAYRVAEVLKPAPAEISPRTVRAAVTKTKAERERDLADRVEFDLKFRRGELTTDEYLEQTDAIGEFLKSRGVDIEQVANQQFEQSWAQATEAFKNSPAGADWPGGERNMQLIGAHLIAMGLLDSSDKAAALAAAYADLKARGMLYAGDVSQEQVIEMTDGMTPHQIIEAFKEGQGHDPEAANSEFISIHRKAGESSGIFGK